LFPTLSATIALTAAQAEPLRGPDFDHDGYEDAAIGAPGSNPADAWDAGAVHLLYGSDYGLFPPSDGRTLALSRGSAASPEERLGEALAWGDFDGDCYDDLAVGAPEATVGGVAQAGGVQLFYGSPDGPSAAGSVWLHRNTPGIALAPEPEGRFGATLAAGDFDGDGYDDLAIGAPFDEGFPGCCVGTGDGEVHVLYGAEGGLEALGSQLVTNAPEQHFGAALATGDFNCDGYDDLAVHQLSSAWEFWDDLVVYHVEGQVLVFYGSGAGLDDTTPIPAQSWTTATPGFLDPLSSTTGLGGRGYWDLPGVTLIAGNFDGNTAGTRACDDLAIGIPNQPDGHNKPGAVAVLYGTSAAGLQVSAPPDELWTAAGIGFPTDSSRFGWTLTAGRFDGDPYEDLAVAAQGGPGGSVHVIRGTSAGLVWIGATRWDRGDLVVPGPSDPDDMLGHGLGAGDYDGDGTSDLLVGLPGSDLGYVSEGGMVMVFDTDDDILPALEGVTAWSADDLGALAKSGDHFGTAVTRPRRAATCAVAGPGGPGGVGW
jgi:hypothetical protein